MNASASYTPQIVLYETQIGINSISYGPILIVTSLLNVLLFVYLIKVLYDIASRERRKSIEASPIESPMVIHELLNPHVL